MCGICGMVGKSDKILLQAMCDVLVHRGPDGEGQYLEDQVAIGMRRLAVIDLETGDQPMTNEDQSLRIVYNGEIYNYRELRDTLEKKKYLFKTQSDTEVILHAYKEYGPECLHQFNGMFAFAIWDKRKQELFMARDRVGIKPLYYWDNGGYLLFGSEIKAILQDRTFERRVNKTALFNNLHRLFVPGTSTMFEGIRRLEPGHYAFYRKGRLEIRKYWDFSFKSHDTKSIEEYCELIYEQLKQAVSRRMIADVPVGAFLSGGVDSSGIVGFMSTVSDTPVKTFSLGFEENEDEDEGNEVFNELPYARKVAEYFNTEHHEFIINAKDILQELPYLIWHFDEPYSGSLPQYYISKLAREHVTVALGGLGGDELFGNYGRGYLLQRQIGARAWRYRRFPAYVRNCTDTIFNGINWFSNACFSVPYSNRITDFYGRASNVGTAYVQSGATFQDLAYDNGQILNNDFLSHLSKEETIQCLFEQNIEKVNSKNILDTAFYLDARSQLVNEYLNYTDTLSMASSLEARVPFLDHELIESVLTIPADVRSQQGDLKYLLKNVIGRLMPRELFDRPKGGFALPYGTWLRNELQDLIYDCLSTKQIKERGYFNPSPIVQMVNEHMSGKMNHTYRIWTLLMMEIWHRIYLDNYCYNRNDIELLHLNKIF